MAHRIIMVLAVIGVVLCAIPEAMAQRTFVHPGITHKRSDLDRMKAMVAAQIDPWYSSYQTMSADSKASYTYVVRGSTNFVELGRDSGTNYGAWNSDIRAAYYNAIRWYVTGDTRHADKAVEIFNAWTNLTKVTSGGTDSLSGGVGYIMIEAAELIKSTYPGWATGDINNFKKMLVHPGYSNTGLPPGYSSNNRTFYWMSYQGDAGRHGNQGLSGWRTVMAMGIFLDNEIMYDRALRYIKGLPHRTNDIAYPAGPKVSVSLIASDDYVDTYSNSSQSSIQDYGFNEVMTNYIWSTGQCQESSRDQQHTTFGLGLLTSMSEMAWNQGDNLYGIVNDRLLLGLEYNLRYNVSAVQSYPDQPAPWVPTVASGEFMQGFDRTGRWFTKAINPDGVGGIFSGSRPVFEMPVAHYLGRGLKTAEEAKWLLRARDRAITESGNEVAGWTNDALGWGGLNSRRPDFCYGDPISGFANGVPLYAMNSFPCVIEAENYDHFAINGEGRTYHDLTPTNTGGQYRLSEGVDVSTCSEGGYCLSSLQAGEWTTYTVSVPATGLYDISIRYAAAATNGKIKFSFGGTDKTSEVTVPFGAPGSTGPTDWKNFIVASGVLLNKGVQSMKLSVSGTSDAFLLNSITVLGDTNSLVAHWKFDESAGATAADATGRGYAGTVTSPNWVAGADGNALNFNGTSTTVNVPAGAFTNISSRITIAMWVNGDALQPLDNSAFYAVDGSNNRVLNIHLPWSNTNVYWDAGFSGGYDRINKLADPSSFKGGWNHWAFTKDAGAGTMKIYLNGALWHSGTGKTKTITGITQARIGSQITGVYYRGVLDDVRLYNAELSASEILGLYYGYPIHGVATLAAQAASATQINLSWTAIPNATSYTLKRALNSGGLYTTVASGLTATNYANPGLTAGTRYYYVVNASYSGTEGAGSAEVSAVPSAPINPATVVISAAQMTSNGSGGQNVVFTVTNSELGHNFKIQATTSLTSPVWADASDVMAGTGAALQIAVPLNPAQPQRFYRLVAWRQ